MSASQYGYASGVLLPSRGYLLVSVSDTTTKVEYIRTYLPSEETAQRHNRDVSDSYTILKKGSLTDVIGSNPVPLTFALSQNYPNPFNPSTTISFDLPMGANVKLDVYNPLGQLVKTLVNAQMLSGSHSVLFDASQLPSGIYFYRLSANNYVESKKMVYLK
jgi:hypothetical protein